MATPIAMPSLGYMMEQGTVATWLKKPGERVERGEAVVQITTEKINYDIEASATGYVHPVAQEGQVVPVGHIIGYLLAEGEEPPAARPVEAPSTPTAAAQTPTPTATRTEGQGVIASPAARRLARELGVDLGTVKGSGPGGRIVEKDVEEAARAPRAAAPTPTMPGTVSRVVPLTGLRGAIAQRMHQSLQTGAQYTLTLEADVTDALQMRRQFSREQRGAEKVSIRFADVIVRAVAEALQRHPALNALVVGQEVRQVQEVHIGVAVALEEGLIVPVVRNAQQMSIPDIARAAQDMENRAKTGQLTPDEVTGSTFTISVLGTVDAFTPIINPPEVAILGVGQPVERPAVFQGQIVPRSLVTLSLTIDHRAVDGAPAASFLRRLKRLLEQPRALFYGGEVAEEGATTEE